MFSQMAQSDCSSSLFALSAFDTFNKKYPVGAEPMRTDFNKVDEKVYIRSDEIFRKTHRLMQKAEKNIYLQTWRFDTKSKPARYFADGLRQLSQRRKIENKKELIHVWMLINIIDTQHIETEEKEMASYLQKEGLFFDNIEIHLGFFKAQFLGASHAKVVSIDNKEAIITGANFSKNYNNLGFFDFAFVVRGDVVKNLDYDFVQMWISYIKENSRPRDWGQSIKNSRLGCQPILFTRSKAYPGLTKQISQSSINNTLINSMIFSEQSIDIITPNLNVIEFMNEILRALARGVQVRIILSQGFLDAAQSLPTRGGSNQLTVQRMYKALFSVMSKRKACQFLQIKWYSDNGRNAIQGSGPPANHAKFMIVDGQTSFIGSANMDNQSWVNSKEVGLFIDNKKLSKKWLRDVYEPIFTRSITVNECLD